MIYQDIFRKNSKKKIGILIDPEKHNEKSVLKTIEICEKCSINFLLVGGSLVSKPLDGFIHFIKKHCTLPVILFPGSLVQISDNADAILLLSLITGRKPELLIGNHVIAAPLLKKSKLEVIPTGYMLIESGKTTAVQYISNTSPIPTEKPDLAVATALAGEMMGLQTIYLEAGSGATKHVPLPLIEQVKKNITIPLIVGGGIRTREHIETIFKAGADIVIIGNSLENNPEKLKQLLQ